jgi:hypothetical protein
MFTNVTMYCIQQKGGIEVMHAQLKWRSLTRIGCLLIVRCGQQPGATAGGDRMCQAAVLQLHMMPVQQRLSLPLSRVSQSHCLKNACTRSSSLTSSPRPGMQHILCPAPGGAQEYL